MNPEQVPQLEPEILKRLRRQRVAVVDDVPFFSEMIIDLLKLGNGIENSQAFSSCEAFLSYASNFNLCFLDGNLGPHQLTGPQALPLIRAVNPDIFVVAITEEKELQTLLLNESVNSLVPKTRLAEQLPQVFLEFNRWLSQIEDS